ncbi:MAG: hypothetical protein D6725_16880 [Planctomycetota bacterium]|nr:MAG: hypothetical protein D6725_16880 [Planctomycetota bacterium]
MRTADPARSARHTEPSTRQTERPPSGTSRAPERSEGADFMKIEAAVEIDAPLEEVFRWTTEHVPEWSETVVREEIIERTPEGVGSRFRCICRERENGPETEFDGELVRHEPPHRATVVLRGRQFDLKVDYVFEPLGPARARVTQRTVVRGKTFAGRLLFAILGPLARRSSCRAAARELDRLKTFCERRTSQPYAASRPSESEDGNPRIE